MSTPCPWDAYAAGTVRFCEARLCATIVEPANAWSNAGFLVVGLYLLYRCTVRRHLRTPLVLFCVTAPLVSVGSFLFHMTGTFWGEYLDLSAMFLISSLMLALELRHLLGLSTRASMATYAALAVASMAAVAAFRTIGIGLFMAHITLWTLLVAGLWRKSARYRTGQLASLIVIFLAGYGAWNLDFRGVLCDPDNHVFNGHVLWHLAGATSLLLYYLHQERVGDRGRVLDPDTSHSGRRAGAAL